MNGLIPMNFLNDFDVQILLCDIVNWHWNRLLLILSIQKNVPWILNCLIFSASFRTLIFLMFPGRLFQKPEKEFCRIFSKNFWINRLKWFIHTLTVQKTGLDTVFLLLMGLHWRFPCPMIPLRNLGLLPAATIMMFSGLKVCSQLFMMSFSTR